jgi:hypothetical protein
VGGAFGGFWGFWLTALLVGAVGSWLVNRWDQERRLRARMRDLGAVESPHNQGKLGSLYLAYGRARSAIAPLERAVAGEPDSPEWRWRLGQALLATGEAERAAAELERCAALAPMHAYGDVQLRLAQARLVAGQRERALEPLAVFEREQGPSPESAFLRGRVLAALGRRDEARASYAQVGVLVERGAQFQRGRHRGLAWRARLARWI